MDLTQGIVKELLDYHPVTGQLFWKYRGRHWFNSKSSHRGFNARYAGKECGKDKVQIKVLGVCLTKTRLVWIWNKGWLPDPDTHKIITINRNKNDTRMENLHCVPNYVSCRQRLKECNVNHSTVQKAGVYHVFPSGNEYFVAQAVNDPWGKDCVVFKNQRDAEAWRDISEDLHYQLVEDVEKAEQALRDLEEFNMTLKIVHKGLNHGRSKIANIYSHKTDELIAENICISEWVKDNNYSRSLVCQTARGKLKQTKGIYARYV